MTRSALRATALVTNAIAHEAVLEHNALSPAVAAHEAFSLILSYLQRAPSGPSLRTARN